jgi:nitrous oxide reductase accessory protein NosL
VRAVRWPGIVAAAVLTSAVLASCSVEVDTSPPVPYPLAGMQSACDEFGNRVYRHPSVSGFAVVGQDPTCPVVSGTSNSGQDGSGSPE